MKNSILLTVMILAAHANAGGGSSVGPENPASALCGKLGGTLSILEDEGRNQWGFCTFDRAIIEEWTLFRHLGGEKLMATQAFLDRSRPGHASIDLPNPADHFCQSIGGVVRNWSGSPGYPTNGPTDLCQFSDRSTIGTWTLFYGPSQNPVLARLLESHPRDGEAADRP